MPCRAVLLAAYGVSWTTANAWATALSGNWTENSTRPPVVAAAVAAGGNIRTSKVKGQKRQQQQQQRGQRQRGNSLGRCPLLALIGLVLELVGEPELIPISVFADRSYNKRRPKRFMTPTSDDDDDEAWRHVASNWKHVAGGQQQWGSLWQLFKCAFIHYAANLTIAPHLAWSYRFIGQVSVKFVNGVSWPKRS